jgi:hypothetical protein
MHMHPLLSSPPLTKQHTDKPPPQEPNSLAFLGDQQLLVGVGADVEVLRLRRDFKRADAVAGLQGHVMDLTSLALNGEQT